MSWDLRRHRHLQRRAPRRRLWYPSAGASRDYAIVISRNPNNRTSTGASGDYAIVISCNPNNGTSARASGGYAIIINHNPDNGT